MLSQTENELMTQIGPGTPAGNLLRRYWHPICPVSELPTETNKKRVRMLGEDLVLFRDGKGRMGLVAEQCPHRRASLFYGFVEDDGLRCAYHGWKFDHTGQCIEQPFEPANSPLKTETCQPAYQVERLAGMYWGYLGPQPAPLLPRWEPLVSKAGPRRVFVLPMLECNWLQCMENSVDTTHTYYLHGHMMVMQGKAKEAAYYYRPIENYDFEVCKEDTWAGVRKIRTYGGDKAEKELGHPLIFPCILLSPQREHLVMHYRLPVDDTHTQIYRIEFTPGGDTTNMDWDNPPVDYSRALKDASGEFLLDSFSSQDAMAWETQGPVVDRSLENLGTSDRGVVLYRRMLQEQIAAVQQGKEPLGVVRDPKKNEMIVIKVSEGQARMARSKATAAE